MCSPRSACAPAICWLASPTCSSGPLPGRKKAASVEDWVEALAASSNDLEEPANRIQPVIGKVISALNATNGVWLARMSGSGATCFGVYENTAEAGRAAEKIRRDHPPGGCTRAC